MVLVIFMIWLKIRNLRTEKGMKQSELAEATGLSRISIGNYERGNRQPSVNAAAKIAYALGVTVDYLLKEELNVVSDRLELFDDDSGFLEDKKDRGYCLYYKIVRGVGQLPVEDQEEILALVEAKMRRLGIWENDICEERQKPLNQ